MTMVNVKYCPCPRHMSHSWWFHAQRGNHKPQPKPCSICDTIVCRCQLSYYSYTKLNFFGKIYLDFDNTQVLCKSCKAVIENVQEYPLAFLLPNKHVDTAISIVRFFEGVARNFRYKFQDIWYDLEWYMEKRRINKRLSEVKTW